MKRQDLRERLQLVLLPLSQEMLVEKRSQDQRGEAHFIVNDQPFCRLACLSLKAGAGSRGNHYHQRKTEGFYLVSGRLLLKLKCLPSGQELELELLPGSRFFIPPLVAHCLTALEDLWFVEFTGHPYEQSDDCPYSFT